MAVQVGYLTSVGITERKQVVDARYNAKPASFVSIDAFVRRPMIEDSEAEPAQDALTRAVKKARRACRNTPNIIGISLERVPTNGNSINHSPSIRERIYLGTQRDPLAWLGNLLGMPPSTPPKEQRYLVGIARYTGQVLTSRYYGPYSVDEIVKKTDYFARELQRMA